MKKFAFTVLAAATTFAVIMPAANAQSVTSGFNVTATLAPRCIISTFTGDVTFGTVSAFAGPTASTGSAVATIRCSRGIATPLMTFDTVTGTASSSLALAAATGAGVLSNGLYYTLSAALGTAAPGIAPTAAGGLGNPDSTNSTVTVSGSMPAQAGTNVAAGTQARTMTVSF